MPDAQLVPAELAGSRLLCQAAAELEAEQAALMWLQLEPEGADSPQAVSGICCQTCMGSAAA